MKKLVAILLSITVCLTAFVGCKGGQNQNKDAFGNTVTDQSKILDISIWNSGYGVKWINALANQYKQDHPGVAININEKFDQNDFNNSIQASNTNKTDIYFNYAPNYLDKKEFIEPLDDLLAQTVEGESLTIGQKFGEKTLSALSIKENGQTKTYALTYGSGVTGIVYNAVKFEEYGLTVPKTSNQLMRLLLQIQEETPYKGVDENNLPITYAPMCHVSGYSSYLATNWWLQYDGAEEFNKFFTFESISENETFKASSDKKDISYLKNEVMSEGMQIGLQTLYDTISPQGVTASWSGDAYSTIQYNFIKNDHALLYVCGGWLETELEKTDGFDMSAFNKFKMMPIPVLSDIAYKLSLGDEATESDLVALIDYVDGVTTEKPSWATDADVKLVSDARFASTGQTSSATVVVPKYSKAIELAKDFLKYMYSDAGLKLFAETQRTCLNVTPSDANLYANIDKSTWSTFSKSMYDLSSKRASTGTPQNLNHPIWYNAGRREIWVGVVPETRFTYDPSNDNFMDAEEFIDYQWGEFQKEWRTSYFKYF